MFADLRGDNPACLRNNNKSAFALPCAAVPCPLPCCERLVDCDAEQASRVLEKKYFFRDLK